MLSAHCYRDHSNKTVEKPCSLASMYVHTAEIKISGTSVYLVSKWELEVTLHNKGTNHILK